MTRRILAIPLIGFNCDFSDAQHFSEFPTWHSLGLTFLNEELTTATVRSMSNLIAHTSCTLRSLNLFIKTTNFHADTCQILDITVFSWILAAQKRGVEPQLTVCNSKRGGADSYTSRFVLFPLVASCSLVMPQISFKRGFYDS